MAPTRGTRHPLVPMLRADSVLEYDYTNWASRFQHLCNVSQRGRALVRRFQLSASLFVLALLPARYLLGPTGPLEYRERNPEWAPQLRALNQQIGARRAVIFNVPTHIEAMFSTPYVAYDFPATAAQADDLRRRGYDVYVFADGVARPFRANAE